MKTIREIKEEFEQSQIENGVECRLTDMLELNLRGYIRWYWIDIRDWLCEQKIIQVIMLKVFNRLIGDWWLDK